MTTARPGSPCGRARLGRARRTERSAGAHERRRSSLLAPNVPELLIAHFAVPLAGGVLIALNSRL
ncbi:hypothetical protein, partial [Rhodococcus aetherivorans]